MKRIVQLFFVLVIFGQCFAIGYGQTARVVGWNIKGVDEIPKARAERIAKIIKEIIKPDLIVLTEVNPNSTVDKIVAKLGSDYKGVILEQKPTTIQNIAFVYKSNVAVTDVQLIKGSDLAEEERSREALAAKVKIGNFDFILIGVHLKSSRDKKEREMRTRQCKVIAKFIKEQTKGKEKDVLVIGDYNMIPREDVLTPNDEENFNAMSDNFLRFVSTDFLKGQASHISKCEPFTGNLLDGFAITKKFTEVEYIAKSTKLLPGAELWNGDCKSYNRNVSDHFPVVSEFNVGLTDDD